MYITDIALNDFRSYQEAVLHLDRGICLLVGANGQGKTNFIEAVGYLANFHSHRAYQDSALVRFLPQGQALLDNTKTIESCLPEATPSEDELSANLARSDTLPNPSPQAAVIRVKGVIQGREVRVDLEIVAGKANRARLGRNPVSPKEVQGVISSVLFAPEDLQILRGDPTLRRRFLDDLLVQLEPVQGATIANLQKVLRQRGALLKQAQKLKRRGADLSLERSTLEVWNQQLSHLAAQLTSGRLRALDQLRPYAQAAYQDILGLEQRQHSSSQLGLTYRCSYPWPPDLNPDDSSQLQACLYQVLTAHQDEEINRGVNLFGPHRDDVELSLDALPIKGFASHGETWSAALALRLGQFQLLRQLGPTPILILDDVFAELDASRREALVQVMQQADQVLITAAVPEDLPSELEAQVFQVTRHADGSQITPLTEHPKTLPPRGIDPPQPTGEIDPSLVTAPKSPDNQVDFPDTTVDLTNQNEAADES